MALFRAIESAQPARQRLFHDPFAPMFVSAPLRRVVRWSTIPMLASFLRGMIDRFWPGARTSAVARTRLIDDWIADSVRNGSQQLLVLGAGFDSRAWRLPILAKLPVFEVDHAATAAEKGRRIAALAAETSGVVSIAIDFDREQLPEVLSAAGFDPRIVTTVVWEGVTNYLTTDAVASVLSWVGTLATGSTLIFTYIHRDVLAEPARFEGARNILMAVARAGEPWTFGMAPEALPRCLQSRGLRLLEDLGADDYRARYFGPKAHQMRGYSFYRTAVATVASTDA
jgi:methyltransferase (TIGR00027 family)